MNVAVWVVQVLLGVTFMGTGLWKVATPIAELGAKMPWMAQVSPAFLYLTGAFDFLGGAGILLPSITRIQPKLAVLAALGCAALMAAAAVFHFSRGEGANTPFNFVMLGLSLFVAWGRWKKVPIVPR